MSKEFQIRDGNLIASFDLENEDGDIDFCKLLKVSHGVAEEIGMFVDYIATNKIIGDQSKEIADLEAKLAESEKSKESYRLQNEQHHLQLLQVYSRLGVEAFGADIHEKALETLMIMKEQLAEKEKETTKLKEVVDCVDKLKQFNADMKNYALVNRDIADEIYCEHQDKISFAVEQLEKAKSAFGLINSKLDKVETIKEYIYYIDHQIKQLKEMK